MQSQTALALDAMPTFPSGANRTALHQKLQAISGGKEANKLDLNLLSTEERWHWHAYDYGWRRVIKSDRQPVSPIDPDGDWYDAALAQAAELYWRRRFNKPTPKDGDKAWR